MFNKPAQKNASFLEKINDKALSFRDIFLQDNRFIIASDSFLNEIELLVENIDFNKDKQNFQILITKFEGIEMELDGRYKT